MNKHPFKILVVEDDPGDSDLALEAIHEFNENIAVDIVEDGTEAIGYLSKLTEASEGLPQIIFLDLNLPKKDGRETLREIKENSAWNHIPVIIFTTSTAEKDIQICYNLGCNSFINKPIGLENFFYTMNCILEYWLKTVRLMNYIGTAGGK